jgi:hypothetical protein
MRDFPGIAPRQLPGTANRHQISDYSGWRPRERKRLTCRGSRQPGQLDLDTDLVVIAVKPSRPGPRDEGRGG